MNFRNLNALRMFDASARHLNFARAADELHLTQGAVAQQVRKLEADLGQKLFVREARGLSLTSKGAAYAREISAALIRIEVATQVLTESPENVTLSVPPSFASKFLVPRLQDFRISHPDLSLRISASEAISDVTKGQVNIAIRQGHKPKRFRTEVSLLSPLNLLAATSPSLAKTLGHAPELITLLGAKLVQDGHALWEQICDAERQEAPKDMLNFNQTALAIDAAATGLGICLAPELLLRDDLASGRLCKVWQPPQQDQGFYLVRPDMDAPQETAIQSVSAWLTKITA